MRLDADGQMVDVATPTSGILELVGGESRRVTGQVLRIQWDTLELVVHLTEGVSFATMVREQLRLRALGYLGE